MRSPLRPSSGMTKNRLICKQAVHKNCCCEQPVRLRNLLCSILFQLSLYYVVDGHFYCLISQLASSGVRANGFCSLINTRQLGVVTKAEPSIFSQNNTADSYLGSPCMSFTHCTHKSAVRHRSVRGLQSDQYVCAQLLYRIRGGVRAIDDKNGLTGQRAIDEG